jgi:hypothetical protein
MGKIDHHDLTKIQWSKLPSHPGNARYRIAAGGSEKDRMIYFSGGTDNPYNYNGIGYNGVPAEPSPMTFAFSLRSGKWETINLNTPDPPWIIAFAGDPGRLGHRGGMQKGQQVTKGCGHVETAGKQNRRGWADTVRRL